jgi:hypothetical protein
VPCFSRHDSNLYLDTKITSSYKRIRHGADQ